MQFAKEELLRVGAVASLLRCLAAGPQSPVAHAAAHTLGNMCGHEATGREILRMQGPTSMQVMHVREKGSRPRKGGGREAGAKAAKCERRRQGSRGEGGAGIRSGLRGGTVDVVGLRSVLCR